MTTKFWTEELLATCQNALSSSLTIPDALVKIKQETGQQITYSQIRHAFKRNGFNTPAAYLSKDEPELLLIDLASDMELLTRPGYLGGVGASQGSAITQLEHRLGVPLDAVEDGLSDAIKDATRTLIDERQRKRFLQAEARSNHALQDRIADLHQAMRNAIKFVKKNVRHLELTTIPSVGAHTLFIPLADIHYGKTHTDRFGKVSYNKTIIKERLQKILSNALREIENNEPSSIIVWIAGDLFEAPLGNMRRGQARHMDLFGSEAFVEARDGIVSLVKTLEQESCLKVDVLITAGNHDRLTEEKDYSSEDFMMFLFADSLQNHLRCAVHALAPVANLLIENMELILLHGHRNRLTNENAIHAIVNNHGMTANRKLVMQGHYHNVRWLSGKNWDCVTLPSVCGNDDFSQYDINKYAEARHCMFRIYKDNAAMVGPFMLT
jgi:predicted phosphodiesterase